MKTSPVFLRVSNFRSLNDGISQTISSSSKVSGLGSLAAKSTVASSDISDGTIVDGDLAATAAIDAAKIGDGSVSTTEFQYLSAVSSDIQTQINSKASATNPVISGVLTAPSGSAGAPSYTFTGNTNTGMLSGGTNQIRFSTNGFNRMLINSDGKVGLNQNNPKEQLHLEGNLLLKPTRYLSSNLYYDGGWKYVENGYGMQLYFDGVGGAYFASAPNNSSGADANATIGTKLMLTNDGSLGLSGITDPKEGFHTGSNILMKPNKYLSSNLYYDSAWKFAENGYGSLIKFDSSGNISWDMAGNNSSGADAAASPSTAMLLTSDGNLGINQLNPTAKLHVSKDHNGTSDYKLINAYLQLSPASNQATDVLNSATYSYAYVPGTNSNDIGEVKGVSGYAENQGSGAINELAGLHSWTHNNGGTVALQPAIRALSHSGSGSVDYLDGVNLWLGAEGGTITDMRGIVIRSDISGGTATNRYGIRIESGNGSPTGDDYGVYQEGGTKNYFEDRVGIGDADPAHQFVVKSSSYWPTLGVFNAADTGTWNGSLIDMQVGGWSKARLSWMAQADPVTSSSSAQLEIQTADNTGAMQTAIWIGGDQRVGLGVTYPTHILQINGQGRATSSSWATTSDIRLKDVLRNYDFYGLEDIEKINPIIFKYKTDNPLNLPSEEQHIGIVAQELQEIIPEAINMAEDGYLNVTLDPVIWAMVNAIKDLSANSKEKEQLFETRLKHLEAENKMLKAVLCENFPHSSICSKGDE